MRSCRRRFTVLRGVVTRTRQPVQPSDRRSPGVLRPDAGRRRCRRLWARLERDGEPLTETWELSMDPVNCRFVVLGRPVRTGRMTTRLGPACWRAFACRPASRRGFSDRFRAEGCGGRGGRRDAAERAEAALTAWFAEVLGAPERALSRGRAAFLIVGGPHHFRRPSCWFIPCLRVWPAPLRPGPVRSRYQVRRRGRCLNRSLGPSHSAPIAQPGRRRAQQAGHPATVGNAPLRGRG